MEEKKVTIIESSHHDLTKSNTILPVETPQISEKLNPSDILISTISRVGDGTKVSSQDASIKRGMKRKASHILETETIPDVKIAVISNSEIRLPMGHSKNENNFISNESLHNILDHTYTTTVLNSINGKQEQNVNSRNKSESTLIFNSNNVNNSSPSSYLKTFILDSPQKSIKIEDDDLSCFKTTQINNSLLANNVSDDINKSESLSDDANCSSSSSSSSSSSNTSSSSSNSSSSKLKRNNLNNNSNTNNNNNNNNNNNTSGNGNEDNNNNYNDYHDSSTDNIQYSSITKENNSNKNNDSMKEKIIINNNNNNSNNNEIINRINNITTTSHHNSDNESNNITITNTTSTNNDTISKHSINNSNNRSILSDNNSVCCRQNSAGQVRSSLSTNRKVYGLRPRSALRRLWSESPKERKPSCSSKHLLDLQVEAEDTIETPAKMKPNSNCTKNSNSTSVGGGGGGGGIGVVGSSGKTRGPRSKPLSKYRRITANARERDRMKEINTAFSTLRAVLPTFTNCRISSMTKYTILQLASSYIRGLSELLEEPPSNTNSDKKENRPTFCNSTIGTNTCRDINLSVGISEIPYDRSQQSSNGDKQADFSMYSNTINGVNSFNNITDNHLDSLNDIDNLNDMCWTLDFMLE